MFFLFHNKRKDILMSEFDEWAEPVKEVSISELTKLIENLTTLRAKYDVMKAELSNCASDVKQVEDKILTILVDSTLPTFKCEFGSVSIRNTKTFKQPESLEEKQKLFEYLREKNVFDEMVSVNSRSLSSWASREVEAAEAEGNFGWVPPGLSAPNEYKQLSLRKK